MDTKTFYEIIGSDGDKVLARFMGKEAMVVRFLKKFLDDRNFEEGKQAIEEKDYKKLETAAHTLKGRGESRKGRRSGEKVRGAGRRV